MKKLIDFFIQRSFVVNIISAFIMIAGVVALSSMQRDLIPPFQWQMVNVNVTLPGATPREMEQFVTFPIEEATRGLRGVEKVESSSSAGFTNIRYFFASDFEEMGEASDVIQARLNSIRSQLPDSILSMTVERAQVNEIFLFWLGVENFQETNSDHRVLINNLAQKILDIPGVVNVNKGFRERHISIEFDPEKLKAAEISLSRARMTVDEVLRVGPIGETLINENRISVSLERSVTDIEQISKLPIRSNRSGQSLLLKDIATIEYRLEDRPSAQYINAREGTFLVVLKDINSDTIDLKPQVLELVDQFNAEQDQLKVVTLMDGPRFLEQQIDVLLKNGLLGMLLVILVLMFFLNFRSAAMTALGLATAYTGTFIVLYLAGINIDLLSIIGMILVVGILVDDAVIVTERYMSYLNSGMPPAQAASASVQDLVIPVSGTVITTIVAFAPMIFMKSEISHILFAVPLVVISSLVLSWAESFFILPNHLSHFVKKPTAGNARERVFSSLVKAYEKVLFQFLRFRYLVMVGLVGILILGGFIGAKHMKHDFKLNINSEYVTIYAVLKESDSVDSTYQKIKGLEEFLRSFPEDEIQNVYTNIGKVWIQGKNMEGVRYAQINGYLNAQVAYPSELKKKIQLLVDEKIKEVNNDDFERLYSTIERQGQNEEKGQMVSVRIRGGDRVSFEQIESSLSTSIAALDEVQEYIPDLERMQKSWVFSPNLLALARYQMGTFDLSSQMRGVFAPHLIQETRIDGENLGVYTRVKADDDLEFQRLLDLEVMTPSGIGVPLSYLGKWKQESSLKEINHFDGMRNLTMDFSVKEGSNINAALSAVETLLQQKRNEFPSYEITVANANEQEVKSQAWALKVAVVCIVAVLLVIALVLGSLTQPLLVGLPIPFALVGIILALYLHDMPLGLMALVGLIGTVGVGVNASLVMVDQMNQNTKASSQRLTRQTIIEGASSRFRAIFLTTLTTLAGVFPMAYAIGGESGFTQPLAFALGWGISASTLLTLFALPALLEVREDILSLMGKITHRWKKKDPAQELTSSGQDLSEQSRSIGADKVILPPPWERASTETDKSDSTPRQ